MNPEAPIPNPIPRWSGVGLGRWPVAAAVHRRGRRALAGKASSKERRFYRRQMRRRDRAEHKADERHCRAVSRASEKARKRRRRLAA